MRIVLALLLFGAVLAAFEAGRFIETSNQAHRIGEPALTDGLIGMGLVFVAMLIVMAAGVVLCEDAQERPYVANARAKVVD